MRGPVRVLAAIFLAACFVGADSLDASNIRHYDLRIEPSFSTGAMSVSATIEIDNPRLERTFEFGLNDRYGAVVVTSPGSPVSVERGPGSVAVTVERPTPRTVLEFDLKGALGRSNDENRAIVADSSLFLLWSDRWYPISFDDWATVSTSVVLPEGFQAIAPGRPVQTSRDGGRSAYIFETTYPTVCFTVLADSRWILERRTAGNIRMQTLLYPRSRRFAEQIFRTSAEVLAYYAETYGPYQFDQFSFVDIDSIYARRAFPGFVGYNPSYLEREFSTTGLDAHETALLWWFYTTRGSGPGAFQWSEGFGDYAEILYDERYHKPIPVIFERFREEYLASKPAEDVPYGELKGSTPQKIVHGKYPWLMQIVRFAVGDVPFRRAMGLLFERYRFRTFTMDQFVATLEEGTHQSLKWWRDGWLDRSGRASIRLVHKSYRAGSRYKTEVVLEQPEPPRAMPIEIGIEMDGRMRFERLWFTTARTSKVFVTATGPKRVVLDPHGWILAEKSVSEGQSHR